MFRRKREPSRIPNYLVLLLLALFALVPVLLLALNSLRTTQEIGANPFALPESWLFSNYAEAWDQGDFSTTMVNTVILTGGTIIGVVIIGGLAAFSLARFRFPGANALSFYLLVGTSVPALVFMVPLGFAMALTVRVGLSVGLFLLLLFAWSQGWIQPHQVGR